MSNPLEPGKGFKDKAQRAKGQQLADLQQHSLDQPEVRKAVQETLDQRLSGLDVSSAQAAQQQMMQISSGRLAAEILAEALGFPAPSALSPAASSGAWLNRAPPTAGIGIAGASIQSEIGGAGQGNGLPDYGEWVQLSLEWENSSARRWVRRARRG